MDCVSSGKVTSTEHWNSLIEKPLPVVFVGNKKNLFNDSRCVLIAEDEQVVINTKNSFEVALVLLNKRAKGIWLIEQIKKRIDEKRYVLKSNVENSICLVGHSQFDQWDIDMIGDMPVQNCGISGINSFEYLQLILKQNLFSTSAENIVILHGTNDIVCDKDICEIVDSIQANIDYIKESNPNSRLFLLKCIHVNGRLDRSNAKIDKLNEALLREVRDASLVDVSVFDDEFGNLRAEYTKDGLHLSQAGYTVMNELISGVVKNE